MSSEDEEDFDIDAYQIDDVKRAELQCLMENYEVYDEEQLRLAIRCERRHQKSMPNFTGASTPSPLLLAGNPPPSAESAPSSPTHIPSRFIPPITSQSTPNLEDITSYNHAYVTHSHKETPANPHVHNPITMQPGPLHSLNPTRPDFAPNNPNPITYPPHAHSPPSSTQPEALKKNGPRPSPCHHPAQSPNGFSPSPNPSLLLAQLGHCCGGPTRTPYHLQRWSEPMLSAQPH